MPVLARALRRQEGGQVFALLAIGITAILGLAAFSIDVGAWYQTQRSAQAAADAAATAAADDLPSNPTLAAADASTYVNKNISGATTTVVTPYNSDSSKVKVTVTKSAPSFFAKVFGINSVTVTASSAAKAVVNSSGKYAIFGHNSACTKNNIQIPGSNLTIVGGIRTNGSLSISGNNDSFGVTTYGGPNGCGLNYSGSGDTFVSGPSVDSTMTDWPEPWNYSSIPCNYTLSGTQTIPSSGTTLPSGVYCDTSGTLTISAANVTGNATLIANRVQIKGANVYLTPYYQDLLVYNISTSTFQWSGASAGTTGTIYAPQANCDLSGSSGVTINLFVECDTVQFSGAGWTMNGNGPPMNGSNGSQLIE
jgi:Flp pilus assembly protein TadG